MIAMEELIEVTVSIPKSQEIPLSEFLNNCGGIFVIRDQEREEGVCTRGEKESIKSQDQMPNLPNEGNSTYRLIPCPSPVLILKF